LKVCYRFGVLKNRFQQVVAVIGLAVGLWLVGQYITTLGTLTAYRDLISPFYTPATDPFWYRAGADFTPAEQMLVWLGLVGVWVGLSTLIFKNQTKAKQE
jgi:hypothetical protein